MVSLGQLEAGLPIPLFSPEHPLFYEILSHKKFSRAIYQLSGDCILLLLEYATRGAGKKYLYPETAKNPKFKDIPIIPENYTLENVFTNYEVIPMKKDKTCWGVRLQKKDVIDDDKVLMLDIEWHPGNISSPRYSKDDKWCKFPLML